MRSEWKVANTDAERFFAERFGRVADVAPLRRGLWSSAYGFRAQGRELVVRFSGVRDDFDKDARVARIAPAALHVPAVHEIGKALGGWYAVSERVDGRHMDALDADELRHVLPSLFATLDVLREVDVSDTSGYWGWSPDGDGEHPSWRSALLAVDNESTREGDWRPHPAWRERIERSSLAQRAREVGTARFRELVDLCPEERHLVHSDLLNWNVLTQGGEVTAMLDWGSSLYGDFLHDIAWLCFYWPWYPQWSEVDIAHEAREHYRRLGLDVPRFDERLRCYELRLGVSSLTWYASREDSVNLERTANRVMQLI